MLGKNRFGMCTGNDAARKLGCMRVSLFYASSAGPVKVSVPIERDPVPSKGWQLFPDDTVSDSSSLVRAQWQICFLEYGFWIAGH